VANSGNPGSISQVTSGGTASTYLTFGSNTSPYGLALDAAGALYSANNANASISEIVGGTPSTFTTFTPGQGVRGVAVAANGNVYSTVGTGVKVTTPGGSPSDLVSGLSFPFGLAFDTAGDILVADYVNQTISAYDTAGSLQYSFSTGAGTSNRPRYVAFDVPGSGFNQIVPEPAMGITVLSIACGAFLAYRRRQRARPWAKPTPTTERA
jgi:sugar lactone lactonase YvrE